MKSMKNQWVKLAATLAIFTMLFSGGFALAWADETAVQPIGDSAVTLTKAKVTNIKTKTYTGDAQIQQPVVKLGDRTLKAGRDYRLLYKKNVNAGTATMTVKGIGKYQGKAVKNFRIKPASISKAQVDRIGTQTLTGGAVKPKPRVHYHGRTLKLGKDYKLQYSGNRSVGAAVVYVVGKGNFTGSKARSFSIVKPVLQTVYLTKTGACFHRSWCSSLSRSKIPISRSSAIARGKRPCKVCRP